MEAIARLDIQYLQQLYAKATDVIGTNTEAGIAEGRAIYRRIFTEDATVRAGPADGEQLVAQGPDSWMDVVLEALSQYSSTQHLIGTQLVTIEKLETDTQGTVTAGEASMESYLQAWHENRSANTLWLFLGTYASKVRHKPGLGWQIHEMTLTQTGGENRELGPIDVVWEPMD